MPEVLRAYRLGFAFLWQELLAEARRSGEGAVRALTDTAAVIWSHSDEYAIALTDAYREAVAERMLTADGIGRRWWSNWSPGVWRTTGRCGRWPSCWTCPTRARSWWSSRNTALGAEPMVGVESRLRPFDVDSAWRLQPDHLLGVLSCGRCPIDTPLEVLRRLGATRVGLSPPFSTLDQTPRAVRLARTAMEHAGRHAWPGSVRQLHTGRAGRGRPQRGRDVVSRALRGLLALDAEDRRTLLATTEAWLDAGGSAAAAGQALSATRTPCATECVGSRSSPVGRSTTRGRWPSSPWGCKRCACFPLWPSRCDPRPAIRRRGHDVGLSDRQTRSAR